MHHANPRARSAFTLVELLVVIAIIGTLVSLLLPAVQAAREAARRTSCRNNMKQLGLSLHNYHDVNNRFPSGWDADQPEGEPGWGWASAILPYMEQQNLYDRIRFDLAIDNGANNFARTQTVDGFLCPSDPGDRLFLIGEGEHEHGHGDHEHEDGDENIDAGHKLFEIARANYVGVFGTFEIEDAPDRGDGTFFFRSRIQFASLTDGTSNTIIVGERSSLLGGSLWHGVIHEASANMERIVGVADHTPNHQDLHFDDFSSFHPVGANFLRGDGSVSLINDRIDLRVYQALATRQGGEATTSP
jgi:prepilin-type N-terminal cleavage/methylation domain-containing protein